MKLTDIPDMVEAEEKRIEEKKHTREAVLEAEKKKQAPIS